MGAGSAFQGTLSDLSVDVLCELILPLLSVEDIIRLSCISRKMRVICLEEPLWMTLCLKNVKGNLAFKVSEQKQQQT